MLQAALEGIAFGLLSIFSIWYAYRHGRNDGYMNASVDALEEVHAAWQEGFDSFWEYHKYAFDDACSCEFCQEMKARSN